MNARAERATLPARAASENSLLWTQQAVINVECQMQTAVSKFRASAQLRSQLREPLPPHAARPDLQQDVPCNAWVSYDLKRFKVSFSAAQVASDSH